MLISVFGKNGSGKTTTAMHLAQAISEKNKFAAIVSLEMRYGSLQRSLNVKVNEERSIINALTQNDIQNYSTRYTDNIYIFSLSDADDITKYDALQNIAKDDNTLYSFFNNLNEKFDYVIVDLTEMLLDRLTYFFVKNSDRLLNIFESRAESIAFEEAHKHILNSLISEEKIINILNKHDESIINKSTLLDICNFSLAIDFDTNIIKDEREGHINKALLKKMNEVLKFIEIKNTSIDSKKNIFSKILGRR